MLQMVLIGPLDAVQQRFKLVRLGAVVDDIGAHSVGRETDVVEHLAGATRMLHAELERIHLPVA
eukprot:7587903-Pyramimonas_sp.AAC.1